MKPRRSALSLAVLALAGLLGILSRATAQTPLGPQFRVDPSGPSATVYAPGGLVFDPSGTLWMAWENVDPPYTGIGVRSLPLSGVLTPPLQMLPDGSLGPHLVLTPNGLALFALNRLAQLEMQRFDGTGARRGNRVVIQNTRLANDDDPYLVAALPGGRVFIAWTADEDPRRAVDSGVYGRVLDGQGRPLTRPFRLPDSTRGAQTLGGLAASPDGKVLVTWWQPVPGDPLAYAVFGRRYSPAGQPLSRPFRISRQTTGIQGAAAADAQGAFVVAWESFAPGARRSVYARRFSAQGIPLGPELPVSQQTFPAVNRVRVAMSPAGDFFVAWSPGSCDGCGNDQDIHGRLFRADGTAEDEIVVNDDRVGSQTGPTVAFGPGGLLAVSWYGDSGGAQNGYGMDARLFSVGAAGPP